MLDHEGDKKLFLILKSASRQKLKKCCPDRAAPLPYLLRTLFGFSSDILRIYPNKIRSRYEGDPKNVRRTLKETLSSFGLKYCANAPAWPLCGFFAQDRSSFVSKVSVGYSTLSEIGYCTKMHNNRCSKEARYVYPVQQYFHHALPKSDLHF